MKKQVFLAPLILSLMWLAATPDVFARPRSPADLAQRCVNRMDAKAQRCCDKIDTKVNLAIPRINALLDVGKINCAARVADRVKKRIIALAQRREHRITRLGNSCSRVLLDIGEVELANAVQDAKSSEIDSVNACSDNAVALIDKALEGDSE